MSFAKTESIEEIKARNKELIQEVLTIYPEKTAKRRAKHLNVHEAGKADCGVKSNLKSIPGVMTIRGCAYAGSKGVVWGPIKDMIHISHGPVGCGQYSWGPRRNYYAGTTGIDTFVTLQFTSTSRRRISCSAALRDWVFDRLTPEKSRFEPTPYDVAIIGDYNSGGDA